MKIGYLLQAHADYLLQHPLYGPTVHVVQVGRELARLGHRVTWLAFLNGHICRSEDFTHWERVPVPALEEGPFRLFERGVRRIQYELQLPYAALFDSFRFSAACTAALADCDLFYERMGWMSYGGAIAAGRLSRPLILEVNGDYLSEMEALGVAPRGVNRWLALAIMKAAVARAAHVVATGDALRTQFIERWSLDPARVSVIENGTDLVARLKREALSSFNPAVREPILTLVYLGGFQVWQGLQVLVRALGRSPARELPLRLLLIGTGPEEAAIRLLAQELDMADKVTFLGELAADAYAAVLARADIALSPYCGRREFSGLKLLDYKAAGVPTIASGADGQPALLEHGQTGWIVPPCDEPSLAEAIARLAAEPDLRQRMGRAARLEAERLHGWDCTAAHLSDLFTRVLAEPALRTRPSKAAA